MDNTSRHVAKHNDFCLCRNSYSYINSRSHKRPHCTTRWPLDCCTFGDIRPAIHPARDHSLRQKILYPNPGSIGVIFKAYRYQLACKSLKNDLAPYKRVQFPQVIDDDMILRPLSQNPLLEYAAPVLGYSADNTYPAESCWQHSIDSIRCSACDTIC